MSQVLSGSASPRAAARPVFPVAATGVVTDLARSRAFAHQARGCGVAKSDGSFWVTVIFYG
jgi:hypothetical protein